MNVSPRLTIYIKSLLRNGEGQILIGDFNHPVSETEPYTLMYLNSDYGDSDETITAEVLKSIPVSEYQKKKFLEEETRREYITMRHERRMEGFFSEK